MAIRNLVTRGFSNGVFIAERFTTRGFGIAAEIIPVNPRLYRPSQAGGSQQRFTVRRQDEYRPGAARRPITAPIP